MSDFEKGAEALALLKRIQWSSWDYSQQDGTETSICPECCARSANGHIPTCALARLIADLSVPAPPAGEAPEASAMREVAELTRQLKAERAEKGANVAKAIRASDAVKDKT